MGIINYQEKKMKIALIGQKRVPSREGGVEVVVWELATRLRDAGIEVECYNRSDSSVKKEDYDKKHDKKGFFCNDIRIITIPTLKNGKLNAIIYSFLGSIRALFGKYNVIHYHAEGPCLMLWLPKLFGIRVIATIHGLDWQRAKWGKFASKMILYGEKVAAKYADEIIVLSKNVQEYFLKEYGRETNYIPNGISKPTYLKPEKIKEKYGLQGNDYILTLCRIVPEKGLHYLLEAFRQIDTDKKLVIAGGFSNAVEYMELIRELAAQDKRVILTDFVHDEILAELCSNCYVYCLPSDVEGMSVSLLEAMSYGRCCLVSDIQENIEVVEDKAENFIRGDVRNLKEKLEFLLENPEKKQEYEAQAEEFICKKYNWDRMVKDTIKLYKKTR